MSPIQRAERTETLGGKGGTHMHPDAKNVGDRKKNCLPSWPCKKGKMVVRSAEWKKKKRSDERGEENAQSGTGNLCPEPC